tara:strand:+ start:7077 stop:7376 length:300 start_codon:yes stop_codon:yes gene_type:complete
MSNIAHIFSQPQGKGGRYISPAAEARKHKQQQFLDMLPAAIDAIKAGRAADARELRKFVRACEWRDRNKRETRLTCSTVSVCYRTENETSFRHVEAITG